MYFIDSGKYYKVYKNLDGSMYYLKKRRRYRINTGDNLLNTKANNTCLKNLKRYTRRRKLTEHSRSPQLSQYSYDSSSRDKISDIMTAVKHYMLRKILLEDDEELKKNLVEILINDR
jgi:hypothetical protein